MPTSIAATSPASASTTDRVIREWLFRLGLNFNREVTQLLPLWREAFGSMRPDQLIPLFERALRTCKFFPTIAEIMAPLESSQDGQCDEEWRNLLQYVDRWIYPDFVLKEAPALPEDIRHAASAAGGLRYIESCSTDDLVWAKKRFCEDLARQRKLGNISALLPGSELRLLLDRTARRLTLPAIPEKPTTETRSAREVLEDFKNSAPGSAGIPAHRRPKPQLVSPPDPAVVEQRCREYAKSLHDFLTKYKLSPGTNPPSAVIDITARVVDAGSPGSQANVSAAAEHATV